MTAPSEADWTALGNEATRLLTRYSASTRPIAGKRDRGGALACGRAAARRHRGAGLRARTGEGNLYARLRGDGSARPLILLNHMDVVLASPSTGPWIRSAA